MRLFNGRLFHITGAEAHQKCLLTFGKYTLRQRRVDHGLTEADCSELADRRQQTFGRRRLS